nr:MFS transporter [Streptomyces sp. NBC_00830]
MKEPRKTSLAPLGHSNFRWLVLGRFTTFLGNGIAPIALAFAVLDTTGSARDLGLVVGLRSLANVTVMLGGGVLADRLSRPLLLQGAAVLAGISQAVVATSLLLGFANLSLLMVLALFNGAVAAIAMPTSSALIPETVPADLLRQANAISRIGTNMALTTGAAAGGAVVAYAGSGTGIAIDSASFFASAFFFARIRTSSVRITRQSSVLRDLFAGWREFVSHRWVWVVVLQSMLWQIAWSGSVQVLGPLVADATFGRQPWGLVLALQTLGLIVGGIIALRWRVVRTLAVGVALSSLAGLVPLSMGLHVPWVSIAALAFLAGIALEQFGVAWDVSLQSNVPSEILARVYSYDTVGSLIAVPVGQIACGPLADSWGTDKILISASALIVLSALAALTSRSVRNLHIPSA